VSEPEYASLVWRKSSASGANGNCVEVAFGLESVYVRHSEGSHGLVLRFQYQEWAAFLSGAHNGEFDLPAPPITPESD
jgi:hypothetical protein